MRLCAAAVLAASVGIPFSVGRPKPLPGVALGSFVFLHVEETAVLFFLISAMAVFALRLWRGELPSKTGRDTLEYQELTRKATDELTTQTDLQQVELDAIRSNIAAIEPTEKEVAL